jgi:hypothetical protein
MTTGGTFCSTWTGTGSRAYPGATGGGRVRHFTTPWPPATSSAACGWPTSTERGERPVSDGEEDRLPAEAAGRALEFQVFPAVGGAFLPVAADHEWHWAGRPCPTREAAEAVVSRLRLAHGRRGE